MTLLLSVHLDELSCFSFVEIDNNADSNVDFSSVVGLKQTTSHDGFGRVPHAAVLRFEGRWNR